VNGSVIPKVISLSCAAGSGPPASSRSRWFCQKQSAKATPRTESETTMRAQLVEVLDETHLILV
jgi:hypothetical protein